MGNILLNSATAASPTVLCKAGDILQRDRFDATTVQTEGKIYISNRFRPSTDLTSKDWTELDPLKPGFFVLDFPVSWISGDQEFAVCSHCGGNS